MKYRALRIFEEDNQYIRRIVELDTDDLPVGDVLIKVHYSSLNYKDALSSIGNKGVTRTYPHTPGIDAAGIVVNSAKGEFSEGNEVLVTGYDLGMNTDGGFGEYIRVPAEWVVKKPKNLSLKESMVYGTAGFTSALSVYELIKEVSPTNGEILVIGAGGGVGSHSVKFLSKLGYNVVAVVNDQNGGEYATSIGAKDWILREKMDDTTGKPLLKQRWAGVIDTVGGNPLSTAIRTLKYGGAVTTCGNIAGGDIPNANVYPFILRGIKLIGIDSVQCPMEKRQKVWDILAEDWKGKDLEKGIKEVNLEGMLKSIDEILNQKLLGRVILKHN